MGLLHRIYHKRLKIQAQVKRGALNEAGRIAYILGERFGAREIILFGSLLDDQKAFDEASDIDMAVKGLGENYLRAYGYCLRLSKFKLDVKAYEDMPSEFKRKVDREGRRIYERKRG